MSHTTTVKPSFKSPVALKLACEELGLKYRLAAVDPVTGLMGELTQSLYQTTEVGWATVSLPGWEHPIVFRSDGDIAMDNFNGRWGRIEEFDRFRQAYSKHAVIEQATALGMRVTADATVTADGSLVLELQH